MAKTKVKIELPKVETYLKSLGLLPMGNIQTFIDSEIARLSDPYVPSDTTDTRKSVFLNTAFGSGQLVYSAYGYPEPGRNIWNDERETVKWQDAPKRGPKWVLRMWAEGGREKVLMAVGKLLRARK